MGTKLNEISETYAKCNFSDFYYYIFITCLPPLVEMIRLTS